MDISNPTVSPLRQRMLDDMRMRKMAEHTQDGYIRAVRKLAAFLGRSPDTATIEVLRRFQLHLVDAGAGPATINATTTGLKFFFDITLGHPELLAKMQPVRVSRILPVVLSREEAARLIAAAPTNLKHQAAMSVAYGAGLRVSEIVAFKVSDIPTQPGARARFWGVRRSRRKQSQSLRFRRPALPTLENRPAGAPR